MPYGHQQTISSGIDRTADLRMCSRLLVELPGIVHRFTVLIADYRSTPQSVVSADDSARTHILNCPFEIVAVACLIGVDEHKVVWCKVRKRRKQLMSIPLAQIDPILHASAGEMLPGHCCVPF